jgi:putative ABC transport system ATP-binding protein
MAQNPIMYFKDVVKTRQGGAGYKLAIEELAIYPGERVALIGDSGSGKSTILDIMALVLKPDSAEEFYFRLAGGEKWENLWQCWATGKHSRFEGIRRAELGYVLQTGGLLPFLTVRDNIALPAGFKNGGLKKESAEYLDYLAAELKIDHLLRKYPTQISVGERQRCAIARALVHKPSLVLADEPTASLDPVTADSVFDLLLRLCEDCALVVSTHDHRRLAEHPDFKIFKLKVSLGESGGPIVATVELPENYVSPAGRPSELAEPGAAPSQEESQEGGQEDSQEDRDEESGEGRGDKTAKESGKVSQSASLDGSGAQDDSLKVSLIKPEPGPDKFF